MNDPLSPAAQAVLDAFLDTPGEVPMPMWDYGRDLAAALEAAADQLVPLETVPKMMSGPELERKVQRLHTRSELLSIAAELKQ